MDKKNPAEPPLVKIVRYAVAPMMLRLPVLTIAALLLVQAQTPQPSNPAPAAPKPDALGRSTPYGCVLGFLKAAGEKDYLRAREYLDLRGSRANADELSDKLDAVLNRSMRGSLTGVSKEQDGDLFEGLPPDRERIAVIQSKSGPRLLELVRIQSSDERPVWLFSAQTLRAVPDLYSQISETPIERYIPGALIDTRFLSVSLWRWLAAILSVVIAFFLAGLVTRLGLPRLRPLFHRLTGEDEESDLRRLRGPVRLLFLAAAFQVFAAMSLSLLLRQVWSDISYVLLIIGGCWLVIRLGLIAVRMKAMRFRRANESGKIAVLALFARLFSIVVVMFATALLLNRAGVNLTAFIAGLGVGGIALALAAQKTLENFFGGITVISRDIIRPGDVCTISGQTGTVEEVGLGSTRIRTVDRTVISMPNAQLSQSNLENVTRRDKCLCRQTFGLRFDTTPRQMREILDGIEGILRRDSKVDMTDGRVRFVGFGASSLSIEVYAYILEADWTKFLMIQQRLLLAILDVIASAGASIATPMVIAEPRGPEEPEDVAIHSLSASSDQNN